LHCTLCVLLPGGEKSGLELIPRPAPHVGESSRQWPNFPSPRPLSHCQHGATIWNLNCSKQFEMSDCFEGSGRMITRFALVLLTILTSACNNPKPSAGFRLPDGDAEQGKAAFLELKCHTCHTVDGTNIPAPVWAPGLTSKDYVRLVVFGGEVRHVKTYGELVTSIINPSHALALGIRGN
jgi:hypothetical protein